MGGLAGVMIAAGVWFLYSGYKNVAPVKTIQAALQDPAHFRQIVADRKNLIDPLATGRSSVTAPSTSATAKTTTTKNSPVTSTGTPTQNTSGGSSAVSFARAQVGKPYQFGGTGNPGWDCSGLTQAALAVVGVNVAHHATAQYFSSAGKFVRNADGSKPSLKNVSSLVPGDLVFPYAPTGGDVGHVGIYSGGGMFIEAAKPGTNVREIPLYALYDAKRFI